MNTTTDPFDYSALPHNNLQLILSKWHTAALLFAAAGFLVGSGVFVAITPNSIEGEIQNIFATLVGAAAACAGLLYYLVMRQKNKIQENFAANNSMQRIAQPTPITWSQLPLIYNLGSRVKYESCYRTTLASTPIELAQLRVDVSNKETFRFWMLCFTVDKLLPNLVLDSRFNDSGILSGLPVTFQSDQRLSLEGDFDLHFDLFAAKGAEIDALTLLSPDFMQRLIQTGTSVDLNIVQNSVFLITTEDIFTQKNMRQLLGVAESLIPHLQRKMRSWSYVFPGETYPVLHVRKLKSALRLGRRLVRVPYGATSIVLAVPVMVAISMLYESWPNPLLKVAALAVLVSTAWYLWKLTTKHRHI